MQNPSLNGRNLIRIAVILRPVQPVISLDIVCWTTLLSQEARKFMEVSRQPAGLCFTSYKFFFFVLSYLYNDRCSNAPFLWSLLMTDCSKHRYFNFIFLHCSVSQQFLFFFSFSTKQNSISIGQKIHTKFHHHYKNTKTSLKGK